MRVDSDRVEEALIERYAKRNSDLDMSLNDVKASLDKPEMTIIRWLPKPKFERGRFLENTLLNIFLQFMFHGAENPVSASSILDTS